MPALPSLKGISASVRIVPFDPFADRTRAAMKRNAIWTQLAQERLKPRPDELLLKAYQIWLRVYNRNMARRPGGEGHRRRASRPWRHID
jgi:hypothetical protein